MPLLGDDGHKEMVENLNIISAKIAKPSAIILISAHWEEVSPTITLGTHPSLIYDYYGFPKQAYEIQYPASGDPTLARTVFSLLGDKGIESILDDKRGFDHGLFVPLKIMYPEADVPHLFESPRSAAVWRAISFSSSVGITSMDTRLSDA